MTTQTPVENPQSRNPFHGHRNYSADAVELMRELSALRKQTQKGTSSPADILKCVHEIGYTQPAQYELPAALEALRFVKAMSSYQQEREIPYPTCEHVLEILASLGYHRSIEDTPTVIDGLPIDRRRREEDERNQRTERRTSLEPSAQELLELTEDEHLFLDALKELRETSNRDFASSEELLSILWNLGYRPTGEDGIPVHWLDEEQRCKTQIAFTHAVEQRLCCAADGDFLTSRNVLEIAGELGFQHVA